MLVNGREIGFRRSVRAEAELAEVCPGKKVERFDEMITGPEATTAKSLAAFATMAVVLSEAYEKRRCIEDPSHVAAPLTMDELLDLEADEFQDVLQEAIAAFKSGAHRKVEGKPAPGKKKVGTASSSTSAGTDTKA